jgi:hypothetical protein
MMSPKFGFDTCSAFACRTVERKYSREKEVGVTSERGVIVAGHLLHQKRGILLDPCPRYGKGVTISGVRRSHFEIICRRARGNTVSMKNTS